MPESVPGAATLSGKNEATLLSFEGPNSNGFTLFDSAGKQAEPEAKMMIGSIQKEKKARRHKMKMMSTNAEKTTYAGERIAWRK